MCQRVVEQEPSNKEDEQGERTCRHGSLWKGCHQDTLVEGMVVGSIEHIGKKSVENLISLVLLLTEQLVNKLWNTRDIPEDWKRAVLCQYL